MLSFPAHRSSSSWFLARLPFPSVRVRDWESSSKYMWGFGSSFLRNQGKIWQLCQLLVCTWSPVQPELCWFAQDMALYKVELDTLG